MPPITRSFIRRNAIKTVDELCTQIDQLQRFISSPRVLVKGEVLTLLIRIGVKATEARALLQVSIAEVERELPELTSPTEPENDKG